VTFKLGAYDHSAPLVIDPLLTYVSYLGGSGDDGGNAVAVDSDGSAIVAGNTYSLDFPVKAAFQPESFGQGDVFITKVNPTGTALVYSTYAGGSSVDQGYGIAIDPGGNVYVTGTTGSTDFPVTAGAFQTTYNGTILSAFVTALDRSGGLIYSTFLGGPGGYSIGSAIAVNGSGNAYITGRTSAANFPVTQGAYLTNPGTVSSTIAFVSQLNDTGTALVYSTYLPPVTYIGEAIVLDASANAYVAGGISPNPSCLSGDPCGFLLKLNSDGTALDFSASIDLGDKPDNSGDVSDSTSAVSIATEANGLTHVLGQYKTHESGPNSFLANIDVSGSTLSLKIFNAPTRLNGLALAPSGNLFVTGFANIPTTPGAFQTGGCCNVLAELDPTGTTIFYSTHLTSSSCFDQGRSVAADAFGSAYVTGYTSASDFPVTPGVFQPSFGGGSGDAGYADAFVARIVPAPTVSPTLTATATATATATPTPTVFPTTPRTPLPTHAPTVTIRATPTPTATATATLTVTPTPTPTATPIGPVTYSTEALKFPTRRVGTVSALKFVTMSNPKKNKSSVAITGVAALLESPPILCFVPTGGPPCGFGIDVAKTTCVAGLSVAAGKSCRVAILFSPTMSGPWTGLLHITGNMTNPGSITLIGAGR